jgi:hypothetical protein
VIPPAPGPPAPHPQQHHPGPHRGRGGAHLGANRLRRVDWFPNGHHPIHPRSSAPRESHAVPLRVGPPALRPQVIDGPGPSRLHLRPRPQVIDGPGPGLAPHLRSTVPGHRSTSALWISRYGANEGPIRARCITAPHPYGPGLAPHLRSTALRPRPRPRCTLRPSGPVRPRTAPAPGASTALRPRPRPLVIDGPPALTCSGDNTSSHDNPTKER